MQIFQDLKTDYNELCFVELSIWQLGFKYMCVVVLVRFFRCMVCNSDRISFTKGVSSRMGSYALHTGKRTYWNFIYRAGEIDTEIRIHSILLELRLFSRELFTLTQIR